MKSGDATTHLLNPAVSIATDGVMLEGELDVPLSAPAVVVFAHGSGSSRHSPRNQFVARIIRDSGLGTLLFDLLTHDEEQEDMLTGALRFDIKLLAKRLLGATHWLDDQPEARGRHIGYFGSSTGGGAALMAAAAIGGRIAALVSRGGRPDLAGPALATVRCPTLLIVGDRDETVLDLNQQALAMMHCERELRIIPDASHLFEEKGKLEQVAQISAHWFNKHMIPA